MIFSSNKTILYPNDSITFKAKATDANGLPMLDVATKLTILKQTINKFYTDSMYVDDTLAVFEKPLLTDKETEFVFKTNTLPNADLQIIARLEFRNSNNETQTKQVKFSI